MKKLTLIFLLISAIPTLLAQDVNLYFNTTLKTKLIDSSFVEKCQKIELSGKIIKYLTKDSFCLDEFYSRDYILTSFFTIDELKEKNTYVTYVENLDIGNMKDVTAFALGELTISKKKSLLIWGIQYSSYEACPFYSGTIIFATLLNDGKIRHYFTVFESENSGDAPMSVFSYMETHFSKSRMTIQTYNETFEEVISIEKNLSKKEFKWKEPCFN